MAKNKPSIKKDYEEGRGSFVKETILEQLDPNTGEVKIVGRKTETVRGKPKVHYMLLNKTNNLKELKGLKGNKFILFTLLASQASPIDNTINTSLAMLDEIAAFMDINRKRVQEIIASMEKDCFVIRLWGGKLMLYPNIWVFGGSTGYDNNIRLYEKAVKWRSERTERKVEPNKKVTHWSTFEGENQDE